MSMLLVAREDGRMVPGEFHVLLRHRLSAHTRSVLGLGGCEVDGLTRRQVARLYARLLAAMDTGSRDTDGCPADPAGADEEDRLVVDHVVGRLLEGTWLLLPRAVRRSWAGSIAHDGLYVPAPGPDRHAPGGDGPVPGDRRDDAGGAATAGWYVGLSERLGAVRGGRRASLARGWGWQLETAVATSDGPAGPDHPPALVLGARLHRPGRAPGPECVAVLADIARRHVLAHPGTGAPYPAGTHPDGPAPAPHPTAWLVADRAHRGSPAERWALSVRALGYEPVFDYSPARLGVQAEHRGAYLVDGTWYRRTILAQPGLVDATRNLHAGTIDEERHARLVEARREHALTRRATVPAPACCTPATGTGVDDSVAWPGHAPTPRRVDPSVHAALRQKLPHMGARWRRVYRRLPDTAEALRADAAGLTALVRGPVPVRHSEASLLAAFVLAAVNVRRIDDFWDRPR